MLITRLSPSERKSTGMRSMLPQSRKTTVRSDMSAGGSWKTSSSGRKRDLIGRRDSFAALEQPEALPLVGSKQEALARAQLGGDLLDPGGGDAGALGHQRSLSSSSSWEMRIPCSIVGS